MLNYLEMSLLTKVSGCFLVYSLQTHEALESVSHVVPHNVVVNGDDIVPGIVEEGEEGQYDFLSFYLKYGTKPEKVKH